MMNYRKLEKKVVHKDIKKRMRTVCLEFRLNRCKSGDYYDYYDYFRVTYLFSSSHLDEKRL